MNDELWDTAQIATYLGQSRRHVTNRVTKRKDFPAPAMNTSRKNRKWRAGEVRAFASGGQA